MSLSLASESTTEVNRVGSSSISFSHDVISIGSLEVPISRTDMILLTNMGYKGGGLGVNGQGMTQPLEVVQRPQFASLGYIGGECSKVSEASKTLSKPSNKEDDWNRSQSSHDHAYCIGRTKVISHR